MKFLIGCLAALILAGPAGAESLADKRELNNYGEFRNTYNYESLYKNEVVAFCRAVGVRPIGEMPPKIHVGGAFKAMITDPVKLDRICDHRFFYQLAVSVLICNAGDGLFEFHNLGTGDMVRVRQDVDLEDAERQLGILPDMPVDKPPWSEGYTFMATVLEPGKLRSYDFFKNRRGDRIKVVCVTRLRWKLLNVRTGIERDMVYFFGKWVQGWEFP